MDETLYHSSPTWDAKGQKTDINGVLSRIYWKSFNNGKKGKYNVKITRSVINDYFQWINKTD